MPSQTKPETYRTIANVFLGIGITLIVVDLAVMVHVGPFNRMFTSRELSLLAFVCLMAARGFRRESKQTRATPATPAA